LRVTLVCGASGFSIYNGSNRYLRSWHTSAYVSVRQHTSAYVSIRHVGLWSKRIFNIQRIQPIPPLLAYVRIRQHTSAYVSIRQHTSRWSVEQADFQYTTDPTDTSAPGIRQRTSAYVSVRPHTSAYVSIRPHTSACVSIRPHTSAYVSIRQNTSAHVSIRQHTCAVILSKLSAPLTAPPVTPPPVPLTASLSLAPRLSCQYLYFCTSKASKVGSWQQDVGERVEVEYIHIHIYIHIHTYILFSARSIPSIRQHTSAYVSIRKRMTWPPRYSQLARSPCCHCACLQHCCCAETVCL
jgi:hypothetical protein